MSPIFDLSCAFGKFWTEDRSGCRQIIQCPSSYDIQSPEAWNGSLSGFYVPLFPNPDKREESG